LYSILFLLSIQYDISWIQKEKIYLLLFMKDLFFKYDAEGNIIYNWYAIAGGVVSVIVIIGTGIYIYNHFSTPPPPQSDVDRGKYYSYYTK